MTRRVWAACWTAAPRPRSPRSCGSASAPSPSVTAGRGRGPAGGPPPSPATACPCPAPGRAPPAPTATPGTPWSGGLRSGGHCALCSRGQGGPGAQEAAWLCGDETGNELIRSCGALSKVPPHCDVSRVTSHVQVLGLQRSFSCGDIVSVPSWPPQLLHARSDSWLVSAECDYSWGGPGGGPLARLDANSRYENRAKY